MFMHMCLVVCLGSFSWLASSVSAVLGNATIRSNAQQWVDGLPLPVWEDMQLVTLKLSVKGDYEKYSAQRTDCVACV